MALCEPVAAMSRCLDSVRETLGGLDDKAITQTLRDVEKLSRRTHAVMLELVAEADSRGIAVGQGFASTQRLLAGMLQLSAADARTRVQHAAMVGTRRTITGQALAPQLPATAAALAAGQIGTGQLRVITETIAALPASIPQPARDRAEADLVGYARDFDPRRLRIIAHRLVANLDPDGPAPSDQPSPGTPVRGELWLRDRRDDRLGLEGWLDAEHGTLVRALIEQLAARHPSTDALPDTHTVAERHANALIELCDRARGTDEFPTTAGEPPHLTVTIDWDALRTALGTATLDYRQLINAGDARRLACDCKLIPVVLGSDSEPLDVGRAMRTVPLGIRRALIARDRGCSFPGCNRPPGLCAAHHVRHWIDLGATTVGNCCLLCPAHHQQVHLQGWDITIHGGRVEFRPPEIIDPDRRPLTNPLRH
ncbi:MAG: HNH endonuclease [Pseudonocardiales bacterium]|nr:MAG: HNH endonuclease [Pseudonocardiales bacterium]